MKLTLTHKGSIPPEHCVSRSRWITGENFFDKCTVAVITWEPIESINAKEGVQG